MLIIKPASAFGNLNTEINNGNGKYHNLRSVNSVNATEKDLVNSVNSAKNDWTDWQFSGCGGGEWGLGGVKY